MYTILLFNFKFNFMFKLYYLPYYINTIHLVNNLIAIKYKYYYTYVSCTYFIRRLIITDFKTVTLDNW